MQNIDLNGKIMRVTETAENGVVNFQTIFAFIQKGRRVMARYQGGKIRKGCLSGNILDRELRFFYVQEQTDGVIDHGNSACAIALDRNGKVRLTERFEWGSRPGASGINVFEEV